MKVIGVTGGVGAGKSMVLEYLKNAYGAKVFLADEVAKELLKPGKTCYLKVREIFPDDVFSDDGEIQREKMAELIFSHPEYRIKQNEIVFPAVKTFFKEQIKIEQEAGTQLMIIEAALLIEEHYDEICDELWYIYTREDVRRERLQKTRNYSQEKITAIMASQLSEDEFFKHTDKVIDNSHSPEETYKQIYNNLQGEG